MVYVARQGYAYLILPTAEQLRLYLGAEPHIRQIFVADPFGNRIKFPERI